MTTKDTPVIPILGRFNPWESHHLYWGLIGMLIYGYGLYESIKLLLFGIEHQLMFDISLAWALILMFSVLFAVSTYVAGDDVYQHRRQVKENNPLYHSPVHYFYRYAVMQSPWLIKLNVIVSKFIKRIGGYSE